jgi:hypothetical protein
MTQHCILTGCNKRPYYFSIELSAASLNRAGKNDVDLQGREQRSLAHNALYDFFNRRM